MNYMKPEIEVIELEVVDVIQTSIGNSGGPDSSGKEDALPVG